MTELADVRHDHLLERVVDISLPTRYGDFRAIGYSDGGAFTAWTTPNTALPDVMPSGTCVAPPAESLNPPCTNATATATLNARYLALRSRHPGGANAVLGDGGARLFSNSVHLQTWRSLSTTGGGEVNGEF